MFLWHTWLENFSYLVIFHTWLLNLSCVVWRQCSQMCSMVRTYKEMNSKYVQILSQKELISTMVTF